MSRDLVLPYDVTADIVVDEVLSYTDGFERGLRLSGLGVEQLEELLLDNNVEKCEMCDSYVESSEIEDGVCDDCERGR